MSLVAAHYLAGVHGVQESIHAMVPVHFGEVKSGGSASCAYVVQQLHHLKVPVPSGTLHRFP